MTKVAFLANATRRLQDLFPAFFAGSTKHNHYADFGWPEAIDFPMLYRTYTRNSLAAAGVDKTIAKTWQDNPEIWEAEEPTESNLEKDIRQRFTDLRIWQMFAEADRRSMVGRYSGVILRLRDGMAFDKPVSRVPGGLDGLAGVVPAWEGQLTVAEWNSDPLSENYGLPLFYQFNEAAVGNTQGQQRQFRVHPDRVLIWSDDGTVNGRSALEPGFNDLIDAEKIKGAGGEGFWKTSRGTPIIEAPVGTSMADIARAMGVTPAEMVDAVNTQIDDWQSGFDKGLLLGGMTATPLQITLPSPEHFFAAPVNSFAASLQIPVKILLGSQTGERASTEDAREWGHTNNSRRVNRAVPIIREFLSRLERFGMIPAMDWIVHWQDLTDATPSERMARAGYMADINTKTQAGDMPPFTPDEIREAAGFESLDENDIDGDNDGAVEPPPDNAQE